jgi:hypothetical protein
MRTKIGLIITALLVPACTAYTPIPVTKATSSGTVRVTLTDASHAQTFGALGSQVQAVEGNVISVSDSSLTMTASEVARTTSDAEQVHGETIYIPRDAVQSIESRHIHVARSALVTAFIAGAAIWIGSQGHSQITQARTGSPSPRN